MGLKKKKSEVIWNIDDVLRKHFGVDVDETVLKEASEDILNIIEELGMLPPKTNKILSHPAFTTNVYHYRPVHEWDPEE